MQFSGKAKNGLPKSWKCLAVLALCAAALGGCWILGSVWQMEEAVDSPEGIDAAQSLTYLDMKKDEVLADPFGAQTIDISDPDFSVTQGGAYVLTGDRDCTLRIDAPDETVHLFLNDAHILSHQGPAIACARAQKLIITILPDTENTLADSGFYDISQELSACVHAGCDLILNGTGKLNVNALYKDALRSSDRLKLRDLELDIRCKRTALHGNDGISLENVGLTVASEKNGLRTTKQGGEGRGSIRVQGGDLSIIAGRYAFYAEKGNVYLSDCGLYMRSVLSDFGGEGTLYAQEGVLPQ